MTEDISDNSTNNYTASTISFVSNSFVNVTNLATELTTSHLYNDTIETVTRTAFENVSQQSWNKTKVGGSLSKAVTNVTTSLCSTAGATTTTEDPFDEFGPPEGVEYIFVPLGVMIFVIVLSAVVIIISRKRKLERLRHRLMPLYNFDPGEEGEDDWETELLDEGFSSRQRRVSNSIAT